MYSLFCFIAVCLCGTYAQSFLEVSGEDLIYKGEKVFLSGMNIAWQEFGYDFGNGNYDRNRDLLEGYLRDIAAAGGNSIRKLTVLFSDLDT
jgi:mannan endo-1,4-beta-mannosidase